mmetsp:Transcript_8069/g.27010  ORF Transcript_8069/g.27010 Transcript_8069/m.27010 type:complete len:99 (+) Transcript_8069:51-347(+)
MLGLARWPYSRKRKQVGDLCLMKDDKKANVDQQTAPSDSETSDDEMESQDLKSFINTQSQESTGPAQQSKYNNALSFVHLKDYQELLFLEALEHVDGK